MNRKPIKTIRSDAGHVRSLQHECVLKQLKGLAVFVREIPRDRSIPSPDVFSQTQAPQLVSTMAVKSSFVKRLTVAIRYLLFYLSPSVACEPSPIRNREMLFQPRIVLD